MLTTQRKPFVSSESEFVERFEELYSPERPTFFDVTGPLPSSGRTDSPLAATPWLTAVLKCYAAAGENALHAHTEEDHIFVVLQGHAQFFGPNGEAKTIGPMNGVLMPAGAFYRFQASEGEQLVMLRVGAATKEGGAMFARIGIDGVSMAGDSKENHQVEPVLSGEWFGPASFAK